MKLRTLTLNLSLLIVAAPAWGQPPSPPADNEARRPLNLSLPRDVMSKPGSVLLNDSQDTATRNLRQEEEASGKRAERQPYGTGYEARQRGMSSESSNSGFGGGGRSSGSGAGAGGGGRGGMGRGR
ncbi:MAG: hypothetical protein Q8L56_06300 [Rhodocyclaceae bacterium]|nr:hypothetical protein [Rhodocyclaceae bacterium]